MKDNTVTVLWQNAPISVSLGAKLSAALGIDVPCGGHGKCGNCKVIATGALSPLSEREKQLLTPVEISAGVRLACRTTVLGACTVLPYTAKGNEQIVLDGAVQFAQSTPLFESYGVAFDLGTTTLAARLYNKKGEVVSACGRANPQGRCGSDVISRIEASINGSTALLAELILNDVNEMLTELAANVGIDTGAIDALCITGNTAMLYFLTASDPAALAHAPFLADRSFGQKTTAQALGISALRADATVLCPPCISAFVGADTVCALLATGICERAESALLVDVGTNGEIALWHNGTLSVCSAAAGPAFEGAGIRMGMRGAVGAIDRVALEGDQLVAHVIGNAAPVGICGSGLVDATACLLELGVLDETGYLEEDFVEIAAPVGLFAKDIRMLQLAKSAICAAISTIMQWQSVTSAQLKSLYVAGGFGQYLASESAARIGLLPRALCDKILVVGNAALDGAAMLLLDQSAFSRAFALAQHANVLDLSTSPVFADLYMTGMVLRRINV